MMKRKLGIAKSFAAAALAAGLIFSSTLTAFAATGTEGVKTITLEEAKTMAVKNNYDLNKSEITRMKLSRDEDDTLSKANDAAFLVQAGISIAGKDAYNAAVSGLEVIRMNIKAMEDSRPLQEALIKSGVEAQYIMLLNQDAQMESLEENLANAEKMVRIEKIKNELGMATTQNVEDSTYQLFQLQIGLEQLKNQKSKDLVKFKKLIGCSLSQEIKLAEIEADLGNLPDYKEGLSNAINNGLQIINASRDAQRKKDYASAVQDRYAQGSTTDYKADLDLSDAQAYLEEITVKTEENYNNAYYDLLNSRENAAKAIREADIAERDYKNLKLKYELGMASKLELDLKQLNMEQKAIGKQQATYQYLLAKTTYDLARQGVISMN